MWHVSSSSDVATLRTSIHLLLTYLLNRLFTYQRRDTKRPDSVAPTVLGRRRDDELAAHYHVVVVACIVVVVVLVVALVSPRCSPVNSHSCLLLSRRPELKLTDMSALAS